MVTDRHSKSAKSQFRPICPIRSNLPTKQAPSTEHNTCAIVFHFSLSITDTIRLIVAHLGRLRTSCAAAHPSLPSLSPYNKQPGQPSLLPYPFLPTKLYRPSQRIQPRDMALGLRTCMLQAAFLWPFPCVQPGGSVTTYCFYFDRQQSHSMPSMIHPPEQSSDPTADSPEDPLLVRGIHDPSSAR